MTGDGECVEEERPQDNTPSLVRMTPMTTQSVNLQTVTDQELENANGGFIFKAWRISRRLKSFTDSAVGTDLVERENAGFASIAQGDIGGAASNFAQSTLLGNLFGRLFR